MTPSGAIDYNRQRHFLMHAHGNDDYGNDLFVVLSMSRNDFETYSLAYKKCAKVCGEEPFEVSFTWDLTVMDKMPNALWDVDLDYPLEISDRTLDEWLTERDEVRVEVCRIAWLDSERVFAKFYPKHSNAEYEAGYVSREDF